MDERDEEKENFKEDIIENRDEKDSQEEEEETDDIKNNEIDITSKEEPQYKKLNSEEITPEKENLNKEKVFLKQNSQMKWAVFLMLSVILIIVLIPYIKLNYFDRFDYNGLTFQKTKLGEIDFYSTRFPVVNIQGQVVGDYSFNFKIDPRELDYVEVNIPNETVHFRSYKGQFADAYLSLNPFVDNCEETIIAMANLAGFLRDSNLNVKSGVTDKAYANSNNLTHKWCSPLDTVIILSQGDLYTEGNETSINLLQDNCYEIKFKDCDVLEASEKFMHLILKEYASKF
jgi:hypothetical protein